MRTVFSKYTDSVGAGGGKLFSNFTYLLLALGVYLAICLATYAVLRSELGPNQGASFITFEIATGGDPFNFKDQLAIAHPVLWVWILFLHFLSWLMIPILAATAVDAANRKWEIRVQAHQRKVEKVLRGEMHRILSVYAGLPDDEAKQKIEEFLQQIEVNLETKDEKL